MLDLLNNKFRQLNSLFLIKRDGGIGPVMSQQPAF